jgi:hypothetical protein
MTGDKGLEVGQQSTTIEAIPTLAAGAYTSGDRMGTIITLTDAVRALGESATLQDIVVLDKAKQSLAMDFLFFDELPTVASADEAAIDITDAEMEKCVGGYVGAADQYIALANSSVATYRNIGINMKPIGGATNLYCVLVTRGTPTYGAAGLVIKFKFLQD